MRLNEIGFRARYRQFYSTPYRLGNLARSVGDLSGFDNIVEYEPVNALTRAEYGYLLNEQPLLSVRTIQDGIVSFRKYENKHYMWFDNYVDEEADLIDLENGTKRG